MNALVSVPLSWLEGGKLQLFVGVDANDVVHVWRRRGDDETACGSAHCVGPSVKRSTTLLCRGCFREKAEA